MISIQFQLVSKDVFPHEKDFLILPERILVEVTILAISPRISMLLGSAPLQSFLNLPVWSTLLSLRSILSNPSLPDCKYLPPLSFFNCFVRFKCSLPLRRRVISARVNLCSGENDLGCKSIIKWWFFQHFPTLWWPSLSLSSCPPYVRIPSAEHWGSLGVKEGL